MLRLNKRLWHMRSKGYQALGHTKILENIASRVSSQSAKLPLSFKSVVHIILMVQRLYESLLTGNILWYNVCLKLLTTGVHVFCRRRNFQVGIIKGLVWATNSIFWIFFSFLVRKWSKVYVSSRI